MYRLGVHLGIFNFFCRGPIVASHCEVGIRYGIQLRLSCADPSVLLEDGCIDRCLRDVLHTKHGEANASGRFSARVKKRSNLDSIHRQL